MPGIPVGAGALLTAGLRADFIKTYQSRYKASAERLGNCMQMAVPSDKRTEFFAYPESAPYPEIWERGDTISSEAFDSIGYNTTNKNWGKRIEWHEDDEDDDQIGAIKTQVRQLGENWGTLNERVFFQMLLGSTNAKLLPSIPNAPDGAALYSATHGDGTNRFGVSGGNIISGSGVGSSAAVRTDVFNALELFARFQDTKGEPLMSPEIIEAGMTLVYNIQNYQLLAEALIQSRTLDGGAALTNIVLDSGLKITLWGTQRVTDNDMYIFVNEASVKPLFQLERKPLQERFADMTNSDWARDTGYRYLQYKARRGYGLNLPHSTVKINNA